jgi:protein-tyrosine-phosphatase
MLQIVIICTGNTCRSPMAEVLLKDKIEKYNAAEQIAVASAGIAAWNEGRASKGAQCVMKQRGIDILAHRSRRLSREDIVRADLLLTMTTSHKEAVLSIMPEAWNKVFTLAEFAGEKKDISDPYGGDTAIYEACAVEIENILEKSWGRILELAGKMS